MYTKKMKRVFIFLVHFYFKWSITKMPCMIRRSMQVSAWTAGLRLGTVSTSLPSGCPVSIDEALM